MIDKSLDGCRDSLMNLRERKTLVFVEGNISSGKSTLLMHLQSRGFEVYPEDLHALTRRHEENSPGILELFYSDMKAYAFKLQLYSMLIRWNIIKSALDRLDMNFANYRSIQHTIKNNIVFVERSMFTDYHTFATNLREAELIDSREWDIYTKILAEQTVNHLHEFENINVVFLYVRTHPDNCHSRLIKRDRQEESSVSKDYLIKLDKAHDNWLLTDRAIQRIIVNGDLSQNEVVSETLEKVGLSHLEYTDACNEYDLIQEFIHVNPDYEMK
jgi:deoxyadenosine/deoxycytidine kinase